MKPTSRILFLLILFLNCNTLAHAEVLPVPPQLSYPKYNISHFCKLAADTSSQKTGIFQEKLTASLLIVLLGPFGVHRLYLGTDAKVPIFYTVTLGGGLGVLPIIDLFTIIFSRDLDRFKNNGKVIMWLN